MPELGGGIVMRQGHDAKIFGKLHGEKSGNEAHGGIASVKRNESVKLDGFEADVKPVAGLKK